MGRGHDRSERFKECNIGDLEMCHRGRNVWSLVVDSISAASMSNYSQVWAAV